jgi:DNA-binding NtrC family response regulator
MFNYKILIIDDDKLVTWSLSRDLQSDGCDITIAGDGKSGLTAFQQKQPDLVLLDLKLPDIDGLEILRTIKQENPDAIIIMMTAYATVQTAVDAVKIGAIDFIKKPFTLDELKTSINRAFELNKLTREVAELRQRMKQKHGIRSLVGESECMQQVFKLIRKIAQSDATTILITGESGTGKDLVAKAIHYESKRFQNPFMAINCGSLPDTLLESELFGHEKGAFTDAKVAKKGLFELAEQGTVLLDEIGDASPSLQVKLLRFLEDKTFKRIGGAKDIEVNVRAIAATNQSLEYLVNEGRFREDLFYRLNVIPVKLNPLRERTEDIPHLSNYFIDQFNSEFKKQVKGVSNEALKILKNYHWPGNIRELRNIIERIMILENVELIHAQHLPLELTLKPASDSAGILNFPTTGVALSGMEKELIKQALVRTHGNQTQAAHLLKISRHALRYKMKKHLLLN